MRDFGVKVFCSAIPEGECNFDVYPEERREEINSVRNGRLKKEKFHAWKLLEMAIESLGINFRELDFIKNENGKWVCDKICFSLSHTDRAVAVAVSQNAVGVDIEKVSDRAQRVAKKVFSQSELDACDGDEILYTTKLWTQKEAIFKTLDEGVFSPQSIAISEHIVQTLEIEINGEKYVISVAGIGAENAEFYNK